MHAPPELMAVKKQRTEWTRKKRKTKPKKGRKVGLRRLNADGGWKSPKATKGGAGAGKSFGICSVVTFGE